MSEITEEETTTPEETLPDEVQEELDRDEDALGAPVFSALFVESEPEDITLQFKGPDGTPFEGWVRLLPMDGAAYDEFSSVGQRFIFKTDDEAGTRMVDATTEARQELAKQNLFLLMATVKDWRLPYFRSEKGAVPPSGNAFWDLGENRAGPAKRRFLNRLNREIRDYIVKECLRVNGLDSEASATVGKDDGGGQSASS